jgi:hypothetical protein
MYHALNKLTIHGKSASDQNSEALSLMHQAWYRLQTKIVRFF